MHNFPTELKQLQYIFFIFYFISLLGPSLSVFQRVIQFLANGLLQEILCPSLRRELTDAERMQ